VFQTQKVGHMSAVDEDDNMEDDNKYIPKVTAFIEKMRQGMTVMEILPNGCVLERDRGDDDLSVDDANTTTTTTTTTTTMPINSPFPGFEIHFRDKSVDPSTIRLHDSYFWPDDDRIQRIRDVYVHTCTFCYTEIMPLEGMWCAGCHSIVYCSRTCQAHDWTSRRGLKHSKLCNRYSIAGKRPGVFGKTLCRVFINSEVGSGLFALDQFARGRIVMICRPARPSEDEENNMLAVKIRLMQYKDQLDGYEARKAAAAAAAAAAALTPDDPFLEQPPACLDKKALYQGIVLSKGQKLGATMTDEKVVILNKLGTPIHVNEITSLIPRYDGEPYHLCYELALLNHSCVPNCYYVYDHENGRFYLYAKSNISAGEQLTIRYDDPYSTFRKDMSPEWYTEKLWSRYGIKCPDGCECQTKDFWDVYYKLLEAFLQLEKIRVIITNWKQENPGTDKKYGEVNKNSTKTALLKKTKQFFHQARRIYRYNRALIPTTSNIQLHVVYLSILEDLCAGQIEIENVNKMLTAMEHLRYQ
jgi:hypothetical protein